MNIKKTLAQSENLRGYKVKLYPSESQKERIIELINLFRFVYNWALEEQDRSYKELGRSHSMYDLFKIFADMRNSNEWLKRIPINSARHAMINACQSYDNFFFHGLNKPKFKRKKDKIGYYKCRSERVYIKRDSIRFEGLNPGEYIYCANHNIPINDKLRYYNCVITYDGFDFWLSISVQVYNPIKFSPSEENEIIGIDIGLRKYATLSNGKSYLLDMKRMNKFRKRIVRIGRRLNKLIYRNKQMIAKSGCNEESKNTQKLRKKYHKACNKRTNFVSNFIYNTVNDIVFNQKPKAVVVEDVDWISLLKTVHGQTIHQINFPLFKRQLYYKCRSNGIEYIVANQYYPSTQICSNCGHKHKQGKNEIYVCENCGMILDRDINAALNLRNYYYESTM